MCLRMPPWLLLTFTAVLCSPASDSAANDVPITTTPDKIGLSAEKLRHITSYLQSEVDSGHLVGAVAAVSRHGKVGYIEAVGNRELESTQPMPADALFRIASMTKAVTSAAVMSLVEEQAIALDDPVSKYIPELANLRVIKSVEGEATETVQAKREPTIHDLLTHRSGFTYGWSGPEKLNAAYQTQNIPNLFEPIEETIGDRVKRLANVPLKFQPGSDWNYGVSTDILGRIIEISSGLTLDQFFRERIFRPLGMHDTYFYVPKAKQQRLAGLTTIDKNRNLQPVGDVPVQAGFLRFSANYCTTPGTFFSGGGGLVSTATDYMTFLHMLLHEGELNGTRILERATVDQMTSNQIGDRTIPFPGHGDGFGLGFGVVTERSFGQSEFSVGSFSWGGIFNTYYWVDPQEQFVGVLMTQVFPHDHLNTRDEFRRLAYEAIDDSGFQKLYHYQPGEAFANPHFNGRQLRVNGAEISTHPKFASRSETRSSGLARIRIDEDLRTIRRADLELDVWGGHPGTLNKRVTINGRSTYFFPEVGTASDQCTHQSPTFNLRPTDLVNGYNSMQFACDTGETFWGHYLVDRATLCIGLDRDDDRLKDFGIADFDATVNVHPADDSIEGFVLSIQSPKASHDQVKSVRYEARYVGYDENGNGSRADWHQVATWTAEETRYPGSDDSHPSATDSGLATIRWETSLLPKQTGIQVRAIIHFSGPDDFRFLTSLSAPFAIQRDPANKVTLYHSDDLPRPFWSRANRTKQCTIKLDIDPANIESVELHVVAWTGGAGDINDYFTLNGHPVAIAEGHDHQTVYSRVPIDRSWLLQGENKLVLRSSTEHHGIEIMAPGPALMIRSHVPEPNPVSVSTAQVHGLECYRVETPKATYYLDKIGAGLTSLVDQDGNDWIGFDPTEGTAAGGEYRGFPNAVFKEAGNYFHALNSGTDRCTTTIEHASPHRVVISALSDNQLWKGRYTFTESSCTFTMERMPPGHAYWVLYEGIPGGQYDDSDWWMTADSATKHPLTVNHEGDINAPSISTGERQTEWIAFGDAELDRMVVLAHLKDDNSPDRFYQMNRRMTVFGFGRDGMQKFLGDVPRSFSIGLVESTNHQDADRWANEQAAVSIAETTAVESNAASDIALIEELQQHALTHRGDAKVGKQLFNDQRTKCSVCHRIGTQGGQVGPDLTKIGGKFDRPHLIDSLLYPSRQIGYGYETKVILTSDGKTTSGIQKESNDRSITLADAGGQTIVIERDAIEDSKVSTTSIMPTGLANQLSHEEFTDLIAYLESLGPGNGRFGNGISGPVTLPPGFKMTTVATGLSGAVGMDIAPDGRVLICEQEGKLRIVKPGSGLLERPMIELPVEFNWERGLIGVTVAPDFPTNPYVYVLYVAAEPFSHHRVARFKVDGDVAIPGSEEILFRGDDQSKFGGNVPAGHQGGAIHFGPDGKLYIGLGEQTAGDPAQRMDALQGKILRLNPDGSIPDDNPFLSQTEGKYQAIWAKGCRNPFSLAFDKSGDMLINDVGGKFEEINRGIAGANYGWPKTDHGPSEEPGITGPIHIYRQSSINGSDFCPSESKWPKRFRGKYFFADFVLGNIKFIDPQAPKESSEFIAGIRRPVDIRFSPNGDLYVLLRNAWVVDENFAGGTGALIKISSP